MSPTSNKISIVIPGQKRLLILVGIAVVLVNLLVLSVHRGIGYGAWPLLFCSLLLVACAYKKQPNSLVLNEKLFIVGLCSTPTVVILSMLLHGDWFWSNLDKPLRFILVIPIFLAIRYFGLHRNYLFIGAIGGAIAAGSFGFYQKYIQGLSVAHGFTHKIPFGDISLMLGMFSLAMFVPTHKGDKLPVWVMFLAITGCSLGLLGSLCSGTRGGWVALPFLVWLVISFSVTNRIVRWTIYVLFLATLIGVYQGNSMVKSKVDSAVDRTVLYFEKGVAKGSAGTRLEMWKGAWVMFTESPWIGVGKENYRPVAEQMKAEGRFKTNVYDHPHNDFLNLLAELGILGGLSLIMLYGLLVKFFTAWRDVDPQLACLGLLLTFGYIDFSLTQAMFEHNISTSFLALNIAVIAGMLSHSYFKQKSEKQE